LVSDPASSLSNWHNPRKVRAKPGEVGLVGDASMTTLGSGWGKSWAGAKAQCRESV
jgi:hypothetical protein